MYVRFWGVRGSIAAPLTNEALTAKIEAAVKLALKAGLTDDWQVSKFIKELPWHVRQTAGGDTACIEIQAGGKLLILDAGTGFRRLGLDLIQRYMGSPIEAHILITHTHWDHISGIPFFTPAFVPDNSITFYSPDSGLEERLKRQQSPEYFPVPLAQAFKFVYLNECEQFQIGDVTVETFPLNHPGGCYSYRIGHDDKMIIYATDSEYQILSADSLKPFAEFYQGADLLIFDAQYTMLENVEKENWGHSNVFTGIDMALEAGVKKLVFTHHEPAYGDEKLEEILNKAKAYLNVNQPEAGLQLYLASEGFSMTL
jgi:phosphoribosyl 1,2-cyclic phosphodiesterase